MTIMHKNLRSDESTCLTFWGMRDDGSADIDSMSNGLFLHSLHTSPLLDKTMGEMWQLMEKHQEMMQDNWTSDERHDHYPLSLEHSAHDEQDVIWGGIICLPPPTALRKQRPRSWQCLGPSARNASEKTRRWTPLGNSRKTSRL